MDVSFDVLSLVIGGAIGGLVSLAYLRMFGNAAESEKLNLVTRDFQNKIKDLESKYENSMAELLDKHKDEIKSVREELTIVTFPYQEESGDSGWINDDRVAEVGYKFQLFIRGIPCFNAHKVVIKRLESKEVNREKIREVAGEVKQLLETVAGMNPAFKVANSIKEIQIKKSENEKSQLIQPGRDPSFGSNNGANQ